jgi:hypothetical protein
MDTGTPSFLVVGLKHQGGGSWQGRRRPARAGCTVRVQVVLVEPTRLVVGQAKMGQGGGDPVMLGLGERDRVSRPTGHDGPLEGRVAATQDRVAAQGVPEAPQGGHLRAGGRDHVHVDPVLGGPVAEGDDRLAYPALSWGFTTIRHDL